jgi:2-methylcitrate dehydratase PrpD
MPSEKEDAAARSAVYATSVSIEDVPSEIAERAKLVFLDTVGVCLRGSQTDYIKTAGDKSYGLIAGAPVAGAGATALVSMDRRPPAEAAFLNAAGGTTLELDEGNQRSAHPGIHVVPPTLAVAEHLGTPGRNLLDALVAGYEVSARFGDLIRPLQEGLHPHGGWAPIGAAVATGRLLSLNVDELATAIRIAANPFVATHWKAALTGATVRNFYAGVCCQHGIRAAVLAAAGVEGTDRAIEDCLLPYMAGRKVSAELLDTALDSLGREFYLADGYFKIHAACRYAHAPIEAVAVLKAEHDFRAEDIERITVRTFERGTLLDETEPRNILSAKFSTPYAVAARLILGRSDTEAFSEELVRDETIQSLASRVNIIADPVFERRAMNGEWGAEVELSLADGSTLAATVLNAQGSDNNPFSREEVLTKFDNLAGEALSTDLTADLCDQLLTIEQVDDVGELFVTVRDRS